MYSDRLTKRKTWILWVLLLVLLLGGFLLIFSGGDRELGASILRTTMAFR